MIQISKHKGVYSTMKSMLCQSVSTGVDDWLLPLACLLRTDISSGSDWISCPFISKFYHPSYLMNGPWAGHLWLGSNVEMIKWFISCHV